MSSPLVSIIVSCYNAEKYVAETLTSLLAQTYQNIEIIIVDDGSTDNSVKIIKSFTDHRIRYYKQNNKGQCAALNYGFQFANGRYIKFYDADDILESSSIEAQVDSLQNSNDEDISFIEWRRFYNNKLPSTIDDDHYHTIHRNCTPLEYLTFTEKMPMVQCGLWLVPKVLLNKSGLWDERLSLINDTEFFPRLLPYAKRLRFSEKGYTLYRSNFNSNSLSADFSKKGIKSALLSIDLMAKWLLQLENSDRIKKIIVSSYCMILEWAFPKQPVYVKVIERRLADYPSTYIHHIRSGKVHNLIMKLLGWKAAARLTKIYYKFRYNKH